MAKSFADFYLIAKEYGEERLAVECLQFLSEAVCVENVALLFSSAWKNKCQVICCFF